MSMEGIIKYKCFFEQGQSPDKKLIEEVNRIRSELHRMGLIGTDKNNIGYGNISIRYKGQNKFIITGSQTGSKGILDNSDYSIVTDFNIEENKLYCTGKIKASSESLTHAAIYTMLQDANSVIHIHNRELWEKNLYKYPTTNPAFEYGTSEIALAVAEICSKKEDKIIILGGHPEGIISYGRNSEEAFVNIMNLINM